MNVPSMKHSDKSSLPRVFKSRASASSTRSSVPSRAQRWKRRWQVGHVWYGGYRSDRSAHCAPVRRIHRMPSSTARLLRQGRSRPSARHLANERFEHLPLLVGQVHGCCILPLDAAYHPFMGSLVIRSRTTSDLARGPARSSVALRASRAACRQHRDPLRRPHHAVWSAAHRADQIPPRRQ